MALAPECQRGARLDWRLLHVSCVSIEPALLDDGISDTQVPQLVFTGMRWHHVTRNPPLVSVSAAVRDLRQIDRTMITITTR